MRHAVQFYSFGVLGGGCGTTINHAVVAVGYGVEPSTGTPYFRLCNSWGEAGGGYAHNALGARGPCRGAVRLPRCVDFTWLTSPV